MKKFLIIIFLLTNQIVFAAQNLPNVISDNTFYIYAPKTGETGSNYFYCSDGRKCSTENVVREYYKNNGYTVMRAEYSFWKGLFILSFLDELYPQAVETKFFDIEKYIPDKVLNKKLNKIKKLNIVDYINSQIYIHEQGGYIRWLDEWKIEGYKNPVEYFKSPIVQEFLSKISNKDFVKILKYIIKEENHNPLGTPDYIIWNNNELAFVEVKRKDELLRPEQIKWGEYLVKNKFSYNVIRVESK